MNEGQQRELKFQLDAVERKLAELKHRWPAHSLKPAMMVEQENLEEERDRLLHLLSNQ